jgi:hypothetical protein
MKTNYTINGNIIWDWASLIPLLQKDITDFSDQDIIPLKIDEEYLEFCKIKLNIHSLIYEKANFNDILNGWNEIKKIIDIEKIAELLLYTTYSRIVDNGITLDNLWKVEPNIIILLKFCYWSSQILQIPTLVHKQKEVRQRLGGKLLRKIKSIAHDSISIPDDDSDENIKIEIDKNIHQMNNLQKERDFKKLRTFLIEYYNFFEVCLSEILYPALSKNIEHEIEFKPRNNDYDYDILISTIPVQVKNSFSFEIFSLNDEEKLKINNYNAKIAKIDHYFFNDKDKLLEMDIKEILQSFLKSNISEINKALKQKAKIIIFDITRTWQGYLLNRRLCEDPEYIKWQNQLKEALNQISEYFVSVIIVARATEVNYRISSVFVKLPILRLLDEEKLNNAEIIV